MKRGTNHQTFENFIGALDYVISILENVIIILDYVICIPEKSSASWTMSSEPQIWFIFIYTEKSESVEQYYLTNKVETTK